MIRSLLPVLFIFCALSVAMAQDDTFTTPKITDDMTLDPEQNKNWRMGEHKFSAKPKNMWELGVFLGHLAFDGDVDPRFPAGFGIGLHARKALHYAFSIRGDLFYGVSKGLDPQLSSDAVMNIDLPSSVRSTVGALHRNYQVTYFYTSIQAVINIGNILFHNERNKTNWYVFVGAGFDSNKTKIDALNGGSAYNFTKPSNEDLNSKSGRKEIKKRLRDIFDGDYETVARKKNAIWRLGDDFNVHAMLQGGVGLSRKLSKRINIAIEHQVMATDNDLIDGFEYRTPLDQSNNVDLGHFTNIRLGINIGDFSKATEPLYWMNPVDGALNDIAELKQRPILDLTDTDGDGIIDMLDQEPNTVAGAPVDVRGIALDSDGDGVADYQDTEPYSAPGLDVDANGVAQQPEEPWLTEDEVVNLINNRMKNIKTEWFLPMIHFDLDKYYVKPEFYGQMHHVASVMREHPDLKISVIGHTDVRKPNEYNTVLSYKRAKSAIDYLTSKYNIPRERFILQYGGEENPLVGELKDNHRITQEEERMQYMNRRVEFKVAGAEDTEMGVPDGPDAGKATPGSSRPGAKYSGNRNSGY